MAPPKRDSGGGAPEERRVALDGIAYTKREFLEFFGRLDEWHAARGKGPTKPSAPKAAGSAPPAAGSAPPPAFDSGLIPPRHATRRERAVGGSSHRESRNGAEVRGIVRPDAASVEEAERALMMEAMAEAEEEAEKGGQASTAEAAAQAEEQKMAAGHVKVKVRVARSPIPLDARPVCALFVSKDGC